MVTSTLTTFETAKLALIPGRIEVLEKAARNSGNMAWEGVAKGVKYARNTFYISAVTTAVALGIMLSDKERAMRFVVCKVVVFLGSGLMGVSGKRLYDSALFLQQVWNAKVSNFNTRS